MFGFSIIVLVGCLFVINNKFKNGKETIKELTNNNDDLKNNIDILQDNIHSGIKYMQNKVTITLDKAHEMYRFEFMKEYEIISDNAPKWYSAQFYANKILDDPEQSRAFYKENVIKWEDLHVRASISFKNSDSQKYTDAKNVELYNISDESNYIPFNIQYTTFKDKRSLDIKKGTKVKLKYCYNVPVKLWGSYLNRTISYFEENTTVVLKYDIDSDLDISVSKFDVQKGKNIEVDKSILNIHIDEENEYKVCKICLEPVSFARYRVLWDSKKYFGNDFTTEDAVDQSQLTTY